MPVSLFPANVNVFDLVRFPSSVGIGPAKVNKWFITRFHTHNEEKMNGPVKPTEAKLRCFKFVSFPNCDGIAPPNELASNLRLIKFVSAPN